MIIKILYSIFGAALTIPIIIDIIMCCIYKIKLHLSIKDYIDEHFINIILDIFLGIIGVGIIKDIATGNYVNWLIYKFYN